jgi:transposase
MGMNLNGKAPKANSLDEANQIIKALWDIIQKLNEKLKTNSKNSSVAPSKDRSLKNKSNIKRTEDRRKNPKKRGGQPGHNKHERILLPLDKVNYVVPCCPNNACACGGQVILNTENYRRHQQYEFPIIRPIVTEYQIYSGNCNQCLQKQEGTLPNGVSFSMLGPRATAMTANLSGTYRISKKNIVNIYRDIFDFNLSVGMVCKAEKTVSRAIAAPVIQAKHFVRSANQVGINADETGFKEKGKSMWAWIAVSCLVAVFIIRGGRCKKIAKALLGKNFKGILCSDRYSAYQWISNDSRQICWAHLERDFRKISERTGSSGIIGAELLTQTNHLFHFWHQFKDGHIDRAMLKKKTKPIRVFIEGLLRQGNRSKNNKTSGTCRNILSYGSALWRFLETEGIEPTNNLAERLIRTIAIWRKTSFGTQSKSGSLYMERMMTVVATCKLQGRNTLDYLTCAVKSYIEKSAFPSLLPQQNIITTNITLAVSA